jgi:hypothetical protein
MNAERRISTAGGVSAPMIGEPPEWALWAILGLIALMMLLPLLKR